MFGLRTALLTCAAALFGATAAVTPAGAQALNPNPVSQPGPPDLVTHVSANKSLVLAGPILSGNRFDSALFTVTVDNQVTVVASNPRAVITQGSDAQAVTVFIALGPLLRQVGNVTASNGFKCTVASNSHSLYCSGGTINVGFSSTIAFEAVSDGFVGCFTTDVVQALADPTNAITEPNDFNNMAATSLQISVIC
jgi:hypothetical protein